MRDPCPGRVGVESWGKAVYREIDAPRTLTYTDYFSDADGRENPDLPATHVAMEFIDLGGRTRVVSRSSYTSPENLKTVMEMGMLDGVTQTWDRLEEHLAAAR